MVFLYLAYCNLILNLSRFMSPWHFLAGVFHLKNRLKTHFRVRSLKTTGGRLTVCDPLQILAASRCTPSLLIFIIFCQIYSDFLLFFSPCSWKPCLIDTLIRVKLSFWAKAAFIIQACVHNAELLLLSSDLCNGWFAINTSCMFWWSEHTHTHQYDTIAISQLLGS